MATSKSMIVMQARNDLPHVWRGPLMSVPLEEPLYCCYTVVCPYCAAYQLRGRALRGDWSRFTCCGGSMPCSGSCGESECPRFCAGVEAVLCFQFSVATTRFQLQDQLRIQNTKCDNCIIYEKKGVQGTSPQAHHNQSARGTMFWLQYLNCICSIVACLTDSPIIDEASIITDRVADIAYCSVCACMQTQHKLQMDERDGLIPPVQGTTIRTPPPPMEMRK